MTPEEVASAAMYLKDTLGKQGIHELISNLSKDRGQYILSFPPLTFIPVFLCKSEVHLLTDLFEIIIYPLSILGSCLIP